MYIILITGGQRSGKSQYAEQLALSLSQNPVYMATAHIWDDEFRKRVVRHQERRGPEWTNIEEERWLSRHDVNGRVVLVDCLTLWATNFFYANGAEADVDAALKAMQEEFDRFTAQDATFIVVTNEIGSGGTPVNDVQRRFTDLLGWLNQYVAARADEVVMMVSGVAVKVKEGDESRLQQPSVLKGTSLSASREGKGMANGSSEIESLLWEKINNLNKPKGSLGRLEELAHQIGMIQLTLSPTLQHPVHLLFGADHGIEKEGVSVSPRCITWQQMVNFTGGGGGVNMFCRQHGFDLRIIDVGVDYDLSAYPQIINRKVASHGTADFLHEPAMTEEQCECALAIGREQVDAAVAVGSNIISIGEMGIANTSPSSIWMNLLLDIPMELCVGSGAGLNSDGIHRKLEILKKSVEHFSQSYSLPLAARGGKDASLIMRYFGGFEMVAAVGAMLHAAEQGVVVLVDGFIMSACALMAGRLSQDTMPDFLDRCIFCHCGDESGHKLMLDKMGVRPILNLGMRLGEGTGALCAFPIIDSAVRMLNEMGNFQDNNITKYF